MYKQLYYANVYITLFECRYSETCTVANGEVCVFTALGTAAVLKKQAHPTAYIHNVDHVTESNKVQTTAHTSFISSSNLLKSNKRSVHDTSALSTYRSDLGASVADDHMAFPDLKGGAMNFAETIQSDYYRRHNRKTSFMRSFQFQVDPTLTDNPALSASKGSPVDELASSSQHDTRDDGQTSSSKKSVDHLASSSNESFSTPGNAKANWQTGSHNSSSARLVGSPSFSRTGDELVPSTSFRSIDDTEPNTQLVYNCTRTTRNPVSCQIFHVPYHHKTAPFAFMRLVPCQTCGRKWVPESLISTVEPPLCLSTRGKGTLLEARICRLRVSLTLSYTHACSVMLYI